MQKESRPYVAGHRGLVGSAIVNALRERGQDEGSIVTRSHAELDLTDRDAVDQFFAREKPTHVYLAAARVGGIKANDTYPAEFVYQNLAIQTNVIDAAYRHGVERLLFLGSSCIYPKNARQPMTEASLLTGPLEPTNRPYAIAKIAGVEMCWSYNRQYGTGFLAAMPTNLYGPGDNYDGANGHVIPALIRRFHEALIDDLPVVTIWGTGKPRREFMYSRDMAEACVALMSLDDARFRPLLASDRNDGVAPIVNIGVGEDLSIAELATLIAQTVGYEGRIEYDPSMPDGTPRKLLDCTRLRSLWAGRLTPLSEGLREAYADFQASLQRSA